MCQGINGTVETTSPPATNPPIGNNSNGLRRPNEPRLSNKAPQLPNGLDSTCRRSEQRDWELTPTTTTSHAANICLRYFTYRPSVELSIEVNIDSLPRFELDEVPTATMNIRGTDSTDKVWNASLAPQPTTPLPLVFRRRFSRRMPTSRRRCSLNAIFALMDTSFALLDMLRRILRITLGKLPIDGNGMHIASVT